VGRRLTDEEWAEAIRKFERTAFRLEQQRQYAEPAGTVERFLAGDPQPLDDVPEFRSWAEHIRTLTQQGKRIERVRVHDDPPTDYQRWERWAGQQTIAAGEVIRYMSRQRAHEVGLLPAAGEDDWWLLDDDRLVVMRFNDDGRLVENELVTDPDRVAQACAWRDLAVHHSAPDFTGVPLS
jgi:hypothetical protein